MKVGSRVLSLGGRLFRVVSADRQLVRDVESLFAISSDARANEGQTHEIDLDVLREADLTQDSDEPLNHLDFCVNYIIGQMMSVHENCLWLDAATVVAPDGRVVLMAGPSGAGKTTLCLAMCLSRSWRAVSEDVTMISLSNRTLIPIARPSSVRAAAVDMLEAVAGPLELFFGRWLPAPALFVEDELPSVFSAAVRLVPPDGKGSTPTAPMAVEPVEREEFLRDLLPFGNAVRMAGAVETLQSALASTECYRVSGGSLTERMGMVGQLARDSAKPGAR